MIPDDFVTKLKQSNKYNAFKNVLFRKIENEKKAKTIIETNLRNLKHDHFIQIFMLVDECYSKEACHVQPGPWFGRLLKPNALNILEVDCGHINRWFDLLVNEDVSVAERIDLLRIDPYRIKGLNVGFITLILYLLDKSRYLIWLKDHHDGLNMLYPNLNKFNGKGVQYIEYNKTVIMFAKQYNFDHSELDYVISGIKYMIMRNYR